MSFELSFLLLREINMFKSGANRVWEEFGKNEPYYGVLLHDKYRKSNLTEANREEFFRSGIIHVDEILYMIKNHIDPNFFINKALDFGCGVGRITIPLARIAKKVDGVDISQAMLNEAKKNCEHLSIKNVEFFKFNNNLSSFENKYNFIHSYIVFQHIPVKRGKRIFKYLLSCLEDNGIFVAHFTYEKTQSLRHAMLWLKNNIPLLGNFNNLFSFIMTYFMS